MKSAKKEVVNETAKKEVVNETAKKEVVQSSVVDQIAKAKALLKEHKELLKVQREEAKAKKEAAKKALENAPIFTFEQEKKRPILMSVSVSRSVKAGKSIIEAAAGNWKLAEIKTFFVEHVVAEDSGMIVEVFDVKEFIHMAESEDGPNRWHMDLVPNPDMTKKYKGHRIAKKRGMASPVLFNF